MFADYYESAEGEVISFERAMQELQKHGVLSPSSIDQFMKEIGYRNIYKAQEVLRWLGY